MDISKIVVDCPFLDRMIDREECASWLKVAPAWLAMDAALPEAERAIPVCKLGHKTVRYHPRTILATLAQRARVSPVTIGASFGLIPQQYQEN